MFLYSFLFLFAFRGIAVLACTGLFINPAAGNEAKNDKLIESITLVTRCY